MLGFLLVAAGCGKTNGGASSGESNAALIAAGRAAFDTHRCTNCHAIGGQGGNKAPDLTHVGSAPGHTPQWLADHVRNPKQHNPGSRMPAFEGKMSEQDLAAVGAFLASLK
jgi:cytochrome c oxidase subunit 2